jgi:hypothetical protein
MFLIAHIAHSVVHQVDIVLRNVAEYTLLFINNCIDL